MSNEKVNPLIVEPYLLVEMQTNWQTTNQKFNKKNEFLSTKLIIHPTNGFIVSLHVNRI